MSIEPFDAYAYYNALKLHFGGKYDAVKYNYKTSANQKSFWKRKDRYFFAKVSRKFTNRNDLINFYVSHFISDKTWIGEMLSDENVYNDWIKRTESLTYNFEQDLCKAESTVDSFDDLFMVKDGQYPSIIQLYLSEEISLETVVVLDQMLGFMKKADKEVADTIMWPDLKMKVEKYSPFLSFDGEKMKKIIIKLFTS